MRTVLSLAATRLPSDPEPSRDPKSPQRIQISLIDISRAYFNAKVGEDEPTFVALPPEHPQAGLGLCGKLLRHMYGTRAAAEGWQSEYSCTLMKLGFRQGSASACVFHHTERRLVGSHGDDFTSVGPNADRDLFEKEREEA